MAIAEVAVREQATITMRGQVVVHWMQNRVRHDMIPVLSFQANMTTEEAIIAHFGSNASTFEELAVQRGWSQAYWTYL